MNKNKFEAITEEKFNQTINEEYQRAKRLCNPLLKGMNRSFVKFYWGKKIRESGGYCNSSRRQISFNTKYRDLHNQSKTWSFDNFILTLRHEIAHLATPGAHHGARFLMILKLLGGHEKVGYPVYEGRAKQNDK